MRNFKGNVRVAKSWRKLGHPPRRLLRVHRYNQKYWVSRIYVRQPENAVMDGDGFFDHLVPF